MSAQECSGVSGGVPDGTDDSAAVHIWRDDTPPEGPDSYTTPVGYETAPGGAGTPGGGLTDHFNQTEEGPGMPQCIQAPADDLRERALSMLDEIRKRQEIARLHRVYYMQLARKYGCTYDEIGRALGITPEGARKFLDRVAS